MSFFFVAKLFEFPSLTFIFLTVVKFRKSKRKFVFYVLKIDTNSMNLKIK